MKKLVIIAISLFAAACSKPDDNNNNNSQNIFSDTTWELTKEEGYEISGDNKEEWTTKPADFDAVYVFRGDNTGTYTTYENFNGNTDSSITEIKWQYHQTGESLAISFIDSGDTKTYKVKISPTTLVLTTHTIDQVSGYEYYNVETYTKK